MTPPKPPRNDPNQNKPPAQSRPSPARDLFSIGILNSLSAHICVLDAEGEIVAINDALRQFGRDNGGDSGALNEGCNYFAACRKAIDQEAAQDAARALAGIQDVLFRRLPTFEMEYDCHSSDEKRWFLMRVTPLQFGGDKAVVAHINITEKKMVEEELSALHSINQAIGTSPSLDAVCQILMEQVAALIQPDLCLIFLRDGDELKLHGARPPAFYHVGEEAHAHRVGQCLCGLAVSSGEAIFSRDIQKDLRCNLQECKAAGLTSFAAIPLLRKGEVVGTIGIASHESRDFSTNRRFLQAVATDAAIVLENSLLFEKVKNTAADLERQLKKKKELEEQLVQAQKVEALGRLAAGMAHEINNPLAGILQNNQILQKRLLEDSPASQEAAKACGTSFAAIKQFLQHRRLDKNFQAIAEAGSRISSIVLDMLCFARKDEADKVAGDAREILDQALEIATKDYDHAAKYDFRKIAIRKEYAQVLPAVRCTPAKIQQVLFNILKNGAEAMAEKIYVSERPGFVLRIFPDHDQVCIEIEDNGPGMNEEVKNRIFEPFFTTKPVGKGTGLGLSVSYFIITENQKGTLAVETEAGKGTRFFIRLPTADSGAG